MTDHTDAFKAIESKIDAAMQAAYQREAVLSERVQALEAALKRIAENAGRLTAASLRGGQLDEIEEIALEALKK